MQIRFSALLVQSRGQLDGHETDSCVTGALSDITGKAFIGTILTKVPLTAAKVRIFIRV